MPNVNNCPKCGETKTMAVPDSLALMCYACKHEFMPSQSISPLRIFLSYGHANNKSPFIHRNISYFGGLTQCWKKTVPESE